MKEFKDGDYISIDNPNDKIRHIFNVRMEGTSLLLWDEAPLNSSIINNTGHRYRVDYCFHVSREKLRENGVKVDEIINDYQIY